MLEPIHRVSVADAVYSQLRDRILAGDLAPGEALPGERKLAELFGVNRGAVREGLRRLAHARLVAVHHGGATRVLDYHEAGLDLLADLLESPAGQQNLSLLRGVLELRNALAPLLAELAAARADAAVRADLAACLAGIEAATDREGVYGHVRTLWSAMARGSGNLALRLALNSLQGTSARHQALAVQVLAAELDDPAPYRALVEAVLAGEGAAAAERAAALVAPTTARAEALLTRFGKAP